MDSESTYYEILNDIKSVIERRREAARQIRDMLIEQMKDCNELSLELTTNDRWSSEYRKWRNAILDRDNFECVVCKNRRRLHVHHIKSYRTEPNTRLSMKNGATLCSRCHRLMGDLELWERTEGSIDVYAKYKSILKELRYNMISRPSEYIPRLYFALVEENQYMSNYRIVQKINKDLIEFWPREVISKYIPADFTFSKYPIGLSQ